VCGVCAVCVVYVTSSLVPRPSRPNVCHLQYKQQMLG